MRELAPAWPPGARLSSTITDSPSDAAYTAGRETSRPGADDGHVVHVRRVEFRQHAEAGREFGIARMTQHRAIGADHQRQVVGAVGEPFDQPQCVFVAFVDDRMRMPVARQESLQRHEACVMPLADENRSASAFFDQRHASQNQRAHDALAQFGFGHDQRAQTVGVDQQRLDGFERQSVDQRMAPRQLTDFGEKISRGRAWRPLFRGRARHAG